MRGLTDIQRAARYLYGIKFSFGNDQGTFATCSKSIDGTREFLSKVKVRLKGIVIEHRDFEPLIKTYDRKEVLFYLGPPYARRSIAMLLTCSSTYQTTNARRGKPDC